MHTHHKWIVGHLPNRVQVAQEIAVESVAFCKAFNSLMRIKR